MPRNRGGYRMYSAQDRCDADWDLRQCRKRIAEGEARLVEYAQEIAAAPSEQLDRLYRHMAICERALECARGTEAELVAQLSRRYGESAVAA